MITSCSRTNNTETIKENINDTTEVKESSDNRWKLISAFTNEKIQKYHYLDTETIKKENNIYSFWVKVERFPAELDKMQNKYFNYNISKYKLDCNSGLYFFEQMDIYYVDKTHYKADGQNKWEEPVPDSVAETIMKDLCK